MNFTAKKSDILNQKTQCAVIFVNQQKFTGSAEQADRFLNGKLSSLIKLVDFPSKLGSTQWHYPTDDENSKAERFLLVQAGDVKDDLTAADQQTLFAGLSKALHCVNVKDCVVYLDAPLSSHAQQLATELVRASYKYDTTKSEKSKKADLKKVVVSGSDAAQVRKIKQAIELGAAVGTGINTARELGNLPGNVCTPSYLANQAKDYAKQSTQLSTKVLTEKQMEKLGMGSLLSVAKGSTEEGKLIIMEYKGNAFTKAKPHVLVGKGITFDTGGISLKPGAGMDEMKFDMCGAASVFGTMQTLINAKAKVNVIAIVAAAENMPAGNASKPGDVVTSMSGQTIEVLNTDAEGRLVLCDALTYAERYKPKSVVDIATLTGACVIALGSHATGLYANDQKLADALLQSGENTHDRAWQMPLWDDYQKQLDSNFADIANIGGREAGSVTAACFLSRFTKKYPWAHLDIAGAAWNSGAAKGATGRPVALLVDYLLSN